MDDTSPLQSKLFGPLFSPIPLDESVGDVEYNPFAAQKGKGPAYESPRALNSPTAPLLASPTPLLTRIQAPRLMESVRRSLEPKMPLLEQFSPVNRGEAWDSKIPTPSRQSSERRSSDKERTENEATKRARQESLLSPTGLSKSLSLGSRGSLLNSSVGDRLRKSVPSDGIESAVRTEKSGGDTSFSSGFGDPASPWGFASPTADQLPTPFDDGYGPISQSLPTSMSLQTDRLIDEVRSLIQSLSEDEDQSAKIGESHVAPPMYGQELFSGGHTRPFNVGMRHHPEGEW